MPHCNQIIRIPQFPNWLINSQLWTQVRRVRTSHESWKKIFGGVPQWEIYKNCGQEPISIYVTVKAGHIPSLDLIWHIQKSVPWKYLKKNSAENCRFLFPGRIILPLPEIFFKKYLLVKKVFSNSQNLGLIFLFLSNQHVGHLVNQLSVGNLVLRLGII